MKAVDLHERFREIGAWVDYEKTCDGFLHGDPEIEIAAVAVCWSSMLHQLRQARELGCNLFICHEPLYTYFEQNELSHPGEQAKADFLRSGGLTVYRCHDLWDVMPEIGIVDSWSEFLGFTDEPAATAKYYNAHDLPAGTTVRALASQVLAKVKELGQESVHVVGEAGAVVTRVAVGTGAITSFRHMAALGADVLVLTDDGTRLWESAVWSSDVGVPLILVNHATAEEPGMRNMATFLAERYGLEAHLITQGCLYSTLQ